MWWAPGEGARWVWGRRGRAGTCMTVPAAEVVDLAEVAEVGEGWRALPQRASVVFEAPASCPPSAERGVGVSGVVAGGAGADDEGRGEVDRGGGHRGAGEAGDEQVDAAPAELGEVLVDGGERG